MCSDNLVQDIIRDIVQRDQSKIRWLYHDDAELKRAFEIYNGIKKAENVILLTIPFQLPMLDSSKYGAGNPVFIMEIFYTDNGHWQWLPSLYLRCAITTLLKNRMKYVSGGHLMKVDTFNEKKSLSSVRYGIKIYATADQTTGVVETSKHSGMLTLIANQDFSLRWYF